MIMPVILVILRIQFYSQLWLNHKYTLFSADSLRWDQMLIKGNKSQKVNLDIVKLSFMG